jgi:hypothetical protein
MAAQQNNGENVFEPPTYSQEIYATNNGSYKLSLQVNRFNDCVRIGITKRIWCEEVNDYVFAKKGHCYFPLEACDGLVKHLATAKKEAERVTQQVLSEQLNCNRNYPSKNLPATNGYAKSSAFAGNGRHADASASKLFGRRANGADVSFPSFADAATAAAATNSDATEHGKRHAEGYKTGAKEATEEDSVEQGTAKKLCFDDEEAVVSKKAQTHERSIARRR